MRTLAIAFVAACALLASLVVTAPAQAQGYYSSGVVVSAGYGNYDPYRYRSYRRYAPRYGASVYIGTPRYYRSRPSYARSYSSRPYYSSYRARAYEDDYRYDNPVSYRW